MKKEDQILKEAKRILDEYSRENIERAKQGTVEESLALYFSGIIDLTEFGFRTGLIK